MAGEGGHESLLLENEIKGPEPNSSDLNLLTSSSWLHLSFSCQHH